MFNYLLEIILDDCFSNDEDNFSLSIIYSLIVLIGIIAYWLTGESSDRSTYTFCLVLGIVFLYWAYKDFLFLLKYFKYPLVLEKGYSFVYEYFYGKNDSFGEFHWMKTKLFVIMIISMLFYLLIFACGIFLITLL